MDFKILCLDGTEGLPRRECKVCKDINRNIIEPVTIFVPENEVNSVRTKFSSIQQYKDKGLDAILEEFYRNLGSLYEVEGYETCIFHCEKENKIWIKNYGDYKVNKDIQIQWNRNLVKKFWEKFRTYTQRINIKNNYLELFDFRFFSFPLFEIKEKYPNFTHTEIVDYYHFLDSEMNYDIFSFPTVIFEKPVRFDGSKFIDDAIFVYLSCKNLISFINCKFYKNLLIDESFIENLLLINTFMDNLTLKNIKINSSLTLKNTKCKNFKFINCDFSKAKSINIEDIDAEDIKLYTIKWGNITEKRICKELFNTYPEKAKDLYRQMKFILDQQKDYITANAFYALEMKAYEKVLNKEGNWQDKLVFYIYKLVSNHGQNWIRPVILLFVLSFVSSLIFQSTYYIEKYDELIKLTEYTYWSYEKGFIYAMYDAFKLYLKFLEFILLPVLLAIKSIAEITKTIKGEFNTGEDNLWQVSFLFLYTITSMFLIYQFIITIRKKVKR